MKMHREIQRRDISKEDYEEALRRMTIFKGFLELYVFNSAAVMVLPAGGAEATYRDELM